MTAGCPVVPGSDTWTTTTFNVIWVMSILTAILSLLRSAPTPAFNVLVSLSTLGIVSTYLISIGCILLKRIRGESLPHAR